MNDTHHILIIDDDPDIRESLCDVLVDQGFEVAASADGLEALDYLRRSPPPCLILLDYMMPRCDGPTFRLEQKNDARLAAIPVVLLTADVRLEEKRRALDAVDLLAKPVQLDDLLAVVRRHC